MEKRHVQLSADDRAVLRQVLSKGHLGARQFKRATGLLELGRGKTLQAVAETLGVNYNTVAAWRDRYRQRGLAALQGRFRCGRPVVFAGEQRAKLTALACGALQSNK